MSYQVVAALVLAKDQQGLIHYVYEGGTIPWLSDEQAAHLVSEGLVIDLGGDAAEPDGELVDAPPTTATKPVLVSWIVANRAKPDGSKYVAADFKSSNKDALWELINGPEDEDDEKPSADADTDELVDWLEQHGEYDRAELEAQSDDQLRELIDATEV